MPQVSRAGLHQARSWCSGAAASCSGFIWENTNQALSLTPHSVSHPAPPQPLPKHLELFYSVFYQTAPNSMISKVSSNLDDSLIPKGFFLRKGQQ